MRQPPGWIHNCLFNKCVRLFSISRLKTICLIRSVYHSKDKAVEKDTCQNLEILSLNCISLFFYLSKVRPPFIPSLLMTWSHRSQSLQFTCASLLLHCGFGYYFTLQNRSKKENTWSKKVREGVEIAYFMNNWCAVSPRRRWHVRAQSVFVYVRETGREGEIRQHKVKFLSTVFSDCLPVEVSAVAIWILHLSCNAQLPQLSHVWLQQQQSDYK